MLAPYGAVGLAAAVALARYGAGRPFGRLLTFEGFVLIVALVARQFLTLQDNVALNRRLMAKVERGNEERWHAREQRFAALGRHSSDPITVVGADGVVLFQSPSVERVLGWGPEATAGCNLRDMLHPADHEQWWALVDRALTSPDAEVTAEWRVRHGDGSWRSLQSVVTNLIDEPTVAGLVLNSRDITAQKALEEQLRFQAFHDSLTGLANRALFEEDLSRAVQRCRRSGASLEVVSIDLHNFKAINDLHGNARGDQLLREVADRLQATFREAEVVARLGGDEFAVLLEVTEPGAGADAAAERLMESFARPFGGGTNQVVLQVIVGVAVSGADGEPDKELLRNADLAMNVAREDGAGSSVTPAVHQRILDRMRTEIELQKALLRDELVLYYQPVVELASGEVKGVEALIRCRRPEKGLVAPGMFIAVAESSGLIVTIGEWVLRQACQDLGKWAGLGAPELRMSVNVSARQLAHPGFEDMVLSVLRDSGACPELITLEITESMLIHDTAGKADVLERLRAMGTRIALDDFGTGYSSLSSIREMPIDILKIDKSFIDNIASSAEAVSLTQTIIHLANDLGLTTIAEGAEELEQVEILRHLGCQLVQGYYFSKPVPAAELQASLRLACQGDGVTVVTGLLLSLRTVQGWVPVLAAMTTASTTGGAPPLLPDQASGTLAVALAVALAMIDLKRRSVVAVSPMFSALMGSATDVDLHALVDDPEALAALMDLFTGGTMDAYEVRREFDLGAGRRLWADCWLAICERGERGYARMGPQPPGRRPLGGGGRGSRGPGRSGRGRAHAVAIALAEPGVGPGSGGLRRRVAHPPGEPGHRGGPGYRRAEAVGSSLVHMLHPDDVARFLDAASHCLADGAAVGADLRVAQRDGARRPAHLVIAPLAPGYLSFGFALAVQKAAVADPLFRVAALERALWRIAQEVEGTGVAAGLARLPDSASVPGLEYLSGRQWEIMTKLLAGEHAPLHRPGLAPVPEHRAQHSFRYFRQTARAFPGGTVARPAPRGPSAQLPCPGPAPQRDKKGRFDYVNRRTAVYSRRLSIPMNN